MSETRFTPGPWAQFISRGPDKCAKEVAIVPAMRAGEIAVLTRDAAELDIEANAALIAAAPDLYELLAYLDRRGGLGIDVHERIKAILAKAAPPLSDSKGEP